MLQTFVFALVVLAVVAILDMTLVGRPPAFVLTVLVGIVAALIIISVGYIVQEMPQPSFVLTLLITEVMFCCLLLRVYRRAVAHHDERTR